MREVIIASAVRTPIGQIHGALSGIRPDDLLAVVLREAVSRAGIDAAEIEEVIVGCANQAGEDNRNVARMALLLAGIPQSVPGSTVNRLCASGLTAINQAARAIRAEEGEIYLAGGVESMTRAPYVLPKNPQPLGLPATLRVSTAPSVGAFQTPRWRPCSRSKPWARPPRTSTN